MTTSAGEQDSTLCWSLGSGQQLMDIHVEAGGVMASATAIRRGTGKGVRVCVIDSGIAGDHPAVGRTDSSWAVLKDDRDVSVEETAAIDPCGHGTACASVIRRVAPDCELHSVRVLDEQGSGSGEFLLEGLRWAVQQKFDLINLSISTKMTRFAEGLRKITDDAYFKGQVIVASAPNSPLKSFPWQFPSVISVGSHQIKAVDLYLYNPRPPVEFFAPGYDVEVAWPGGKYIRATGNSFATPFITGLAARLISVQPGMTPFQVKTALFHSAANVRMGRERRSQPHS